MTPKDFIGSDLGRASPGQCLVKLLKLELDVRFQLKGRHFVWQEREREREKTWCVSKVASDSDWQLLHSSNRRLCPGSLILNRHGVLNAVPCLMFEAHLGLSSKVMVGIDVQVSVAEPARLQKYTVRSGAMTTCSLLHNRMEKILCYLVPWR